MTKVYVINDYNAYFDHGINRTKEYTEEQILTEYWDHWYNQMKKVGREHLISRENCIEDWVIGHWAWEKQ